MANSQLLVIVAVAMVAAVILFRLYAVLGRRTGNEREPSERIRQFGGAPKEAGDNVVPLPERAGARPEPAASRPLDETERALLDIKLADRNFEAAQFLTGAKKAYELIVTAYANGERNALRPLLNDEVFEAFDHALKARDDRHETVKFTFVGFKDAKISHAALKGRTAEVTVAFIAQLISSTTDRTGAVIEGDPANVRDVTDIWSFARDVRASDPNWLVVATSGGEF